MRLTVASLLLASILFFSACVKMPVVVTPDLPLPPRPEMLPVEWTHTDDGRHWIDDEGARALQINVLKLRTHIVILEEFIKAAGGKL